MVGQGALLTGCLYIALRCTGEYSPRLSCQSAPITQVNKGAITSSLFSVGCCTNLNVSASVVRQA